MNAKTCGSIILPVASLTGLLFSLYNFYQTLVRDFSVILVVSARFCHIPFVGVFTNKHPYSNSIHTCA